MTCGNYVSKARALHVILWMLLFHTGIGFSFALTTGQPHSTVQTLTKHNFDEALNDPANGLWLLKFYGK
jgi:hypothetical protein